MRFTSQRRDRVTFFVVLVSVFIANLAYNMLTAALRPLCLILILMPFLDSY